MSTKVTLRLLDDNGNYTQKHKLFITARPALFRWTFRAQDKSESSTWFRRTGADEYMELTPAEVKHITDWLGQTETPADQLTIDQVEATLKQVHIARPKMIVTPGEAANVREE